jgi:hypothetical protein
MTIEQAFDTTTSERETSMDNELSPEEIRKLAEQVFEEGDEYAAHSMMELADEMELADDIEHTFDTPDMTATGEGDDTDPTWEELGFTVIDPLEEVDPEMLELL